MGLLLGDRTVEGVFDSEDTVEMVVELAIDGSDCLKRPLSPRSGSFFGASLIRRQYFGWFVRWELDAGAGTG